MQTQTKQTAKGRHFLDKAEQARRQMVDLDVRIIGLQKQVDQFPNARGIPQIKKLVGELSTERRRLNAQMTRSLFNVGRF